MNSDSIKSILENTIENKSDFSFEMKILEHINKAHFHCEHSGTYLDPYAKINREFDIRAYKKVDQTRHLWLAAECKNISPDLPLIIHSTQMDTREKIHTLMINHSGYKEQYEPINNGLFPQIIAPIRISNYFPNERAFQHHVSHHVKDFGIIYPSLYSNFDYIGKSMDKLKSKGQGNNKEYVLNDGEVYEKFSQCQNSLVDLIEKAACKKHNSGIHQYALIPILVVLNGSLWEQRYNSDGTRIKDIVQVNRIPFYVNKSYNQELHKFTPSLLIRFVEIVTEQGLIDLLPTLEGEEGKNLPTYLLEQDAEEIVHNKRK